MNRFWPIDTESLPLSNAEPDEQSETFYIEFREGKYGSVGAYVFNSERFLVDIVREASFQDAYDAVRRQYTQASWDSEGE